MSNPEKFPRGVLVSLLQACPACDAPVHGNAAVCDQCELTRPESGWVRVAAGSPITETDELEDDPDTATSAPPPVVPANIAPAPAVLRTPVAAPVATTMGQFYVRFFGVFLGTTVLTATIVTLIGMQFLPEASVVGPEMRVVTPSPDLGVPVVPVQPDVEPTDNVTEDSTEAVTDVLRAPVVPVGPVAEPVAVPTSTPEPVVSANPVPASGQTEPVVADADSGDSLAVSTQPVVPEPVVSPPEPIIPEAAQALSGTFIGRADGDPISMELAFGADQRLSAVLRVAGRRNTGVHNVSGTYTLAPDGSADFALSDRTDDGVVGYSGTVIGNAASGIVTVDGRRRGRFSVGR